MIVPHLLLCQYIINKNSLIQYHKHSQLVLFS
jgi:hypothetical protein